MAPRRKIKFKEAEPVVVLTEVQERFDLEPGDDVRFRLNDGQSWTAARVTGENKDGSLSLYDPKMGHSRAIMPEKIQRKKTGPRGGVLWENLT